MDRIERIERSSGLPEPIAGVTRNDRVDPDGSRRDHPPGEREQPRPRRPPAAPALGDDGRIHVDVEA